MCPHNTARIKYVCASAVLWVTSTQLSGAELPSDGDLREIRNTCAVGENVKVQGELDALLFKFRKGLMGVKGNAEFTDIGAIIADIKDDGVKERIFHIYSDCVEGMMDRFAPKILDRTSVEQNQYGDNGVQIKEFNGDIHIK